MITREQATDKTILDFHHNHNIGYKGSCLTWQRNGKATTWLTHPQDFRIPVYDSLNHAYQNIVKTNGLGNFTEFHVPADCTRNQD